MTELRAFASRKPWSLTTAFYLVATVGGRRHIVWPAAIDYDNEIGEGVAFDQEPTFELSDKEAQNLADTLWDAGFRPTQGRQSEGQFAAQSRHLEDMRAIAFDRLKVDKP